MQGKVKIVFLTAEALLLDGGDNLAVAHKAGRAIVVKTGYA
jgi:hypothetical protein